MFWPLRVAFRLHSLARSLSFCTATAIPVTALLSYAIFHKKQSVQFILGMPIVCLAVLMYSTLPGGQGPFSFTIPRPATPK